ncbi:GMC oxidoreductase [Streptomyces sp. NPDC006617]|uniref:GMC family oxidoreductase n=1 Tax=Streptomyces sp. NPDC006617 TaxID=3155354 RepID=UPI00339FE23D
MRSGIGDEGELRSLGIPVVEHLPGVGRNLDDHIRLPCMWEATDVPLPVPTRSQAVCFWEDGTRPGVPEFVMYVSPAPSVSPGSAAQYPPPERCFTLMPAMRLRGRSRGRVRLANADPMAGPRIETNFLAAPDDVRSALSAVAMAREIGNSAALRPFAEREVSPASSVPDTVEKFVRNAVETYWHQSGTARMGRDEGAVVDARLKVHGIEGLRVADASVLPHVTVANTMAPSMVVGERAAEILAAEQG